MLTELKPCPFCGGSATIERYGDRRQSTIYQCDNCSCSLETGEEWGHGADWNRRSSPTNLENAERAEMEPKVKALTWLDNAVGGLVAETAIGDYELNKVGFLEAEEWELVNAVEMVGRFPVDALEAAKAAAQSDFASRICSCLLAGPANNSGSNGETLEKSCRNDAKNDPENQNIDRLRRELEEARKALGKIAAYEPVKPSDNPLAWRFIQEARAALRAGEEGRV